MPSTEINLAALTYARASIAYVVSDAAAALRNEIDAVIAGTGGNARNVAKYTAEIQYAHEIGARLESAVKSAAGGWRAEESAEAARALIARINTDGLARMRLGTA